MNNLIFLFSDELSPKRMYGKIEAKTEIVVLPFESKTKVEQKQHQSTRMENQQEKIKNSLYNRLYNNEFKTLRKPPYDDIDIIDSRRLENVFENLNSGSTVLNSLKSDEELGLITDKPLEDLNEMHSIVDQNRMFEETVTRISYADHKQHKFRAVPKKWLAYQLNDVFLTKNNMPNGFDLKCNYTLNYNTIDENNVQIARTYYVNVKIENEENMEGLQTYEYPCIQINDILMTQLKLQKFCPITLNIKKTVLNFVEKIELIPVEVNNVDRKEILEDFKIMLVECSSLTPLLVNQNQIFKLCGGTALVEVKIYPESFRYCLCDAEILRENKILVSEQTKDSSFSKAYTEEISEHQRNAVKHKHVLYLDAQKHIISDCVMKITARNGLSGYNRLRKSNNFIIAGIKLEKNVYKHYFYRLVFFQRRSSDQWEVNSMFGNIRHIRIITLQLSY